jgi:hypothetical protein
MITTNNKIKHSKFKNSYLIYEFLTRQIACEIIDDSKTIKESKAYKIIQKHYNRGVLVEEFGLYQAIINNRMSNKYGAEHLLEAVIDRYKTISQKELRKSKYNLIKDIKESYDINKLFSTNIPEYKESASVYALFESVSKKDIVNSSRFKGILMETIMTPKNNEKTEKIMEAIDKASPDERKLAYHILVNSFNKKFSGALNEGQKKFIQDYIYSNTLENGWVYEHIKKVKQSLSKSTKSKPKTNDDTVLNLKLNECIIKMKQLEAKKIFKDDDYYKILGAYKLVEHLESL